MEPLEKRQKSSSQKLLDKIEQDGSLIIAECKNNKEFGDIVEIKLSWDHKK